MDVDEGEHLLEKRVAKPPLFLSFSLLCFLKTCIREKLRLTVIVEFDTSAEIL